MGFCSKLYYLTYRFYCSQLRLVTRGYSRGKVFGKLLIAIKGLGFYLVGFFNTEYAVIAKVDYNLSFLTEVDFLHQLQTDYYVDSMQIIFLIINLIPLCYILWQFILFLYWSYNPSFKQPLRGNSSTLQSRVDLSEDEFLIMLYDQTLNKFNEIMGIYFQLYYFVFLNPMLCVSLSQLQHPLAPVNVAFFILLGTIIIDSDYTYSTKSQDVLGKPHSLYALLLFYFRCFILVLISALFFNTDNLFMSIYFLTAGSFSVLVNSFYLEEFQQWDVFIHLYFGLTAFTFFMSIHIAQHSSIPSAMIFLYIPLIYMLTKHYCTQDTFKMHLLLRELTVDNQKLSMNQINKVIRLKFFNMLDSSQLDNSYKIDIINFLLQQTKRLENEQEYLQNQHDLAKSARENLTLLQMNEQEEDNNSLINESYFKMLFKDYIYKIAKKKNQESYKIIYLVYLLEILNCKKSYWVEYSKMRQKDLTLKQEQILLSIHHKFIQEKELLQKTLQFDNPFNTQYFGVLSFEERISQAYELNDRALKQKVELLVLMRNKQLVASLLLKKVKELRAIQKKLRNELNSLASINNNDPDLLSLQVCYMETLAFSEKDLRFGFNSSSLYNNNFSSINILQVKKQQKKYNANGQAISRGNQDYMFNENTLFDKHSCVVFVTFDENLNLIFRKMSNSFEDIFGIIPKNATGKKIDIIMPTYFPIASKHPAYVSNYLRSLDIQRNYISSKTIFAQSAKGYIIPMKIDIRLNFCTEIKEIGFCAQMKKLTESIDYILFHSTSLNFMGITQNLQTNVFGKIPLNKKCDIGQYFPFLISSPKKTQYNFNQSLKNSTGYATNDWEQNTNAQEQISDNSLNFQMSPTKISKQQGKVKDKIKEFEFMLIIPVKKESSNVSHQLINNTLMKYQIEKDYQFFLMDVSVSSANYQDLTNLSYLKITRVKSLNPQLNGSVIISHLKDKQNLYTSHYSKAHIERLSTEVQMKYKKTNSIMETNKSSTFYNTLKRNSLPNNQQIPLQSPIGLYPSDIPTSPTDDVFPNYHHHDKFELAQNMNINELHINSPSQQTSKINQKISKIVEKSKQIDEIEEEDVNQSNITMNVSSSQNSSHSDEKVFDQVQQKQEEVKESGPLSIQTLSPKGFFSGTIKSTERIFGEDGNLKQYGDSLKPYKLEFQSQLKLNKGQQEPANRNHYEGFGCENQLLYEDGLKMVYDSEKQLPNLSFNNNNYTNLFSLASPNYSHQELFQEKIKSNITSGSQLFEAMNKRDSSQLLGQNSYLGNSVLNPLENSCSTAVAIQQKFFQDKEAIQFNMALLNEGKEPTTLKQSTKQNTDNNKVKKKVKKQDNANDQHLADNNSSTRSRESSQSTIRSLINTISSQTQILAIKFINLMGLLTFTCLITITIQQYISFMSAISQTQDNLTVQSWPQELQIIINRSTKNMNLIQLERQNNFTFASPADQKSFDTNLVNLLAYSSAEYRNQLNIMETIPIGIMLFDVISRTPSYFLLNLYYDSKKLVNSSSGRTNTYYMEPRNSSLQYSIDFMNQYIFRQSINPTAKVQEFNVLQNLPIILNGLDGIQQYFQNFQNQEDAQIQNQLTVLITIILTISAICLLTTLPLYAYIQSKKDMIINLFCTFPVTQIQFMILKIRQSYYSNRAMQPYIKHIPLEIQFINSKSETDRTNLKKQLLSSITKLPRFNFGLLIAITFIYSLLSIYPISNQILISNYLTLQNNNIQMAQKLNKARSFVVESAAMTAFGAMMKIYPTAKVVQLNQYLTQIRTVMNKTSGIINDLTTVSNQISVSGRYNQIDFDNFFFPLFENDICGIIGNNTQYILNATRFQSDFCRTIQSGFFQRGLKLSYKKFSEIVLNIDQIIEITDAAQLQIAQANFFQWMNLKDYSYFIDYLDEIINIMKSFLLNNCTQYYQRIQTVQLILIIYQLVMIGIVFGLGWYIFSANLTNQITITKQYLQVINLYHLLENNYILNFVKNNNKI